MFQTPIVVPRSYTSTTAVLYDKILNQISTELIHYFEEKGVTYKIIPRRPDNAEILKIRTSETVYELQFVAARSRRDSILLRLYKHTDRFGEDKGARKVVLTKDILRAESWKTSVMQLIETYMLPNQTNMRPPKARFVAEEATAKKPNPSSIHYATSFVIDRATVKTSESGAVMEMTNADRSVVKLVPLEKLKGIEINPMALTGAMHYFVQFFGGEFFIMSKLRFDQNFVLPGEQGLMYFERAPLHTIPSY